MGITIGEFEQRVLPMPYIPHGIALWEAWAFCERAADCDMVVESGVAYGRSTEILAKAFPSKRIASIDDAKLYGTELFDAVSKRLLKYPNVFLWRGDSMAFLPEFVRWCDNLKIAALIDGPKGEKAAKLADALLSYPHVKFVAIHDANASYSSDIEFNWQTDHEWVVQHRYLEEANFRDPIYQAEMKNYPDGWGLGFVWRNNYDRVQEASV